MSKNNIPSGWNDGALTDIADVNPSVSLSALNNNDLVSFLSMADVGENGRVVTPQIRFLKDVRNGFTRFAERDVLFAKITPCMENGKGAFATNLVNGLGFGSTEFHVLRANENGDAEFIYHVTQYTGFRSKAESYFSGSAGQQRVSADFFSAYDMLAPPLPQQRKIARILTTVDNLIAQTEALIEKYKSIKQGMMHDLFTRGVDSTGSLRPPYEDAPHLYKQSPLGWIPNEWSVQRLDDISTSMTNGFVGVATPFYTSDGTGIPYLYGNNVRPDKLELHNFLRVTQEFHQSQRKSQLAPGDMLTVQSGHIGTSAIVPVSLGDANCHALIITKFVMSKVFSPFVSMYCNSATGMGRLASIFVGSTILHINVKEFKDFEIPLPNSPDEQREICRRVMTLDRKNESEMDNLKKLRSQKSGLMQDLLTGKVRVNVDEAEEITADV